MSPCEHERVETKSREGRESTEEADEDEFPPVKRKRDAFRGEKAGEESDHKAAADVDDDGSGWEPCREPLRVDDVVHGVAGHRPERSAYGDCNPRPHACPFMV